MERLLLRISDAAERVSVSRSVAYELAHTEWRTFVVKVGKSLRVSARGLDQWAEEKLAEAQRESGLIEQENALAGLAAGARAKRIGEASHAGSTGHHLHAV